MSRARRLVAAALRWLAASAVTWTALAGHAAEPDAAPVAASAEILVMLRSPPAHARADGGYGGAGYADAARVRSQARLGARLASEQGFHVVSQWPMPSLGLDCLVLELPAGTAAADAIERVRARPEVAWAQPMNEFRAQGHADPLYALQPAAGQWHLDALHAVATGRRMRVAVVDSGVDASHPDLAHAVEARENFVDGTRDATESHGTAVAGLVAARADNGAGIVGIAPDARLLALRACWEAGPQRTLCNSLSLAKALDFAIARHAEVINMSLSGPDDLLLGRLIDVALSRRQQVVAAVDAHAPGGGFPAAHAGVIAVTDSADAPLAGLPGAWAAPARDLPATAPGGGWRLVSGSSFAAAQVSGLLALIGEARAGAAGGATAGVTAGESAAATRLVRLPGGGIDTCASLARASPVPSPPGDWSGCRAILASTAPVSPPSAGP